MQNSYLVHQTAATPELTPHSSSTSPALVLPMTVSHSISPSMADCSPLHDSSVTHRSATTASTLATSPAHAKCVQHVPIVRTHTQLTPASAPRPILAMNQHHVTTWYSNVPFVWVLTLPLIATALSERHFSTATSMTIPPWTYYSPCYSPPIIISHSPITPH